MYKETRWILIVALAMLLVTPTVLAQSASPSDVVQGYYAALQQAAAGGDTAALLDLFADDATITVPGLTPQPVAGKEAIQATLGGMFSILQGLTVTLGNVAVDGDKVTVSYTMTSAGSSTPVPATDTFVIQDGKIKSLTIEIAAEALAAVSSPVPTALPVSGGAGSALLPGLMVMAGAGLLALRRRLSA